MLERPLKILVALGLITLYFQRLIIPMISGFNADRQTLVNMKLAAQMQPADRQLLEQSAQKTISACFSAIAALLPAFDQTRDHLWGKIERVRAKHPEAHWEFQAAQAFVADGKLVRWPFSLQFQGPFSMIVSALAWLECDGQVIRLRNLSISCKKPGELAVDAAMELLFLDSAMTRSLHAKETAP